MEHELVTQISGNAYVAGFVRGGGCLFVIGLFVGWKVARFFFGAPTHTYSENKPTSYRASPPSPPRPRSDDVVIIRSRGM